MISILSQIKGIQLPEMEVGKPFEIVIKREPKKVQTEQIETVMQVGKTYKITVKKYMTEPATVSFDFQDKWNNGMPMPLVTMTGEVIKETRGMFYMRLHCKAEPTVKCICCGRTLKNKVSMLYGIGPECGKHFNINPFDSEEELNANFQELKDNISSITWEGWVIKKSITNFKEEI